MYLKINRVTVFVNVFYFLKNKEIMGHDCLFLFFKKILDEIEFARFD